MLHAYVFIFWSLMSGLFGAIANLLIPILLSTKEVIYPQLNILSLNLLIISIVVVVLMSALDEYVAGLGWTLYAPLSVFTSIGDMLGTDMVILMLILVILSSTLTVINFYSTLLLIRIYGCTLMLTNVYIIVTILVSILLLLVVPIVSVLVVLMYIEIHMYSIMFDSIYGGDVLLFQHLFWLFGHPEVYILIFPGISVLLIVGNILLFSGLVNVSLGCVCYVNNTSNAMISIFVLSLYVWAHHMWSTSICIDVLVCYSVLSLLVAVPTGLKSLLVMLLLS